MAKKDKEAVRLNRTDDDSTIISIDEEEPEGFFDRLFSPGTIETDVSGDDGSEFDESVDSHTIFTDITGHSEFSDEVSQETSGTALALFDKELRAKHRNACKNMTVRILFSQILLCFDFQSLSFFRLLKTWLTNIIRMHPF